MAANENTKKWLEEIRDLCAEKRNVLYQIDDIKQESETVFDAANTVYSNLGIHPSEKPDSTPKKAAKLCEKYTYKLERLLLKLANIENDIESRSEVINSCFEDTEDGMSVQEFETIFYYYFEGMSVNEVAAAIYYSVPMVYKYKSKAIDKLAKYRDKLK